VLGKEREAGLALVHNMDALPIPNFDEYFEQLKDTQIAKKISPALLLETSRGCWWGEVSRCTFCGLSAGTIGFRSKSPDRAFDEIDYMSKKHDSTLFELVDNIMDMKYFDTLLPRVADDPRPFRFFYEIKTNLKRDQVEMLDRAGVKWIQPGIEGLNDKLLKIMLKGNNACHGIRLLKWSRQFGIYVMWNYLCDAPGELDEWHKDEIDLIPLLTHLQAPWNAGTSIRFDRFARYTIKADEYQLELEPCDSYQHIYPLQGEALRDQAYFFYNKNKTVINNGEPQPYMDQLKARMEQWRELFYERTDKGLTENPSASAPELRLTRPDANTIVLEDTRPCAVQPRWELTGLQRVVYDACDAGETLRAITTTVHACGHEQVTEGDVQGILDEFVAAKTAVFISSRYLSLGVEAPYKDYEAV
jgi:magnesium-protoporphyrin IX monomethyl ester (oxidative) cyclase